MALDPSPCSVQGTVLKFYILCSLWRRMESGRKPDFPCGVVFIHRHLTSDGGTPDDRLVGGPVFTLPTF